MRNDQIKDDNDENSMEYFTDITTSGSPNVFAVSKKSNFPF